MTSLSAIKHAVCQRYGVTLAEMDGPRRFASIVRARHVAMYLVRELADYSFDDIGYLFGGRHRSTVIHACRSIAARMRVDGRFLAQVLALASEVEGAKVAA